jgi:hypothetical protein
MSGCINVRGLRWALRVTGVAAAPLLVPLASKHLADQVAVTLAAAIPSVALDERNDSGPAEPSGDAAERPGAGTERATPTVEEEQRESAGSRAAHVDNRRSMIVRRESLRGIRVSAALVQRLVRRGARPSGVSVSKTGDRPAGLALFGVNGLGVGAKDGDILTHVGGQPATSLDVVVGAVLTALRRRAPALTGRLWREGEVWQVLVEIPYPEADAWP